MIDVADLPCCYGAGHHPNCPNNDAEPDDLSVEPMSAHDVIRLAERGDAAAQVVIASCMECVGEMQLLHDASDEEIGEWYADALRETA